MAEVRVIREGWWRWIEKRVSVDVTCTTTLITSGDRRILVDVPNAGEEEAMLAALSACGLKAEDIDTVVVTHFHPDHVGCLSLFTKAKFISAHTVWRGAKYTRWDDEKLALTDDVYVLKTPGHSEHDCSVLAETEAGVIAAVGDLWVRSPSDPRILVVADAEKMKKSRARLIGLATQIIPGHGPMTPSSQAVAE